MRAFVMAAGNSERMQPYSRIMDKSMLRLGGKPIVRIIVEKLLASGVVDEITICCLQKHLKDFMWEFRDLPEVVGFSPVGEPMGTAGHFLYAARAVGKQQRLMVHYADVISETDYAAMERYYEKENKPCCISVTKNVRHDYSEVHVTHLGLALSFTEKPLLSHPTWKGIAIFAGYQRLLDNLAIGSRKTDFGYDIFPDLVEKGTVSVYVDDKPWYDIGNVRAYEKLKEAVEKGEIRI